MSNDHERSEIGDSICGLIQQAREGSTDARNQLMAQLRSYVALVASKVSVPELNAKLGNSDLIQESIVLAVEKFDQFKGKSEAELFAWIKVILENEVRQAKRSFRSEKRDIFRERPLIQQHGDHSSVQLPKQLVDKQLTPQTFALKNEDQSRVQSALKSLEAEHRQVIELRNWQKMSFRDIGQKMNRSENAATKLWYRALIALRKALEQGNGG